MSFPLVLLQPQARNETQETELTTVKLTPNAHSNFQTRFVVPVQGHVLDSNSALVWRIDWDGYDDAAKAYEKVVLKQYSGGLNTLRRARFYIGGREIFSNEDVGHLVHIKRIAKDPDYVEETTDKQIGSQHGYYIDNPQGGVAKFRPGPDADEAENTQRYTRQLGSGNAKGIECSLLLSEIFSALESLQLPTQLDQMRIELDWETDFDEVATIISQGDNNGGNNPVITDARKAISIKSPVLLLDYLSFEDDMKAGLDATIQQGLALPYVHTSMSTKILSANAAATAKTDDVQIALQGKLLMKMYVSHRFSDTNVGGAKEPYQLLQGRCRSQRGNGFQYNLFINDLAIHDQPVNSSSLAWSYLENTHQKSVSVMAGLYDRNAGLGQAADAANTVSGEATISGVTTGTNPANATAMDEQTYKDGLTGTQSYIGFDLSKYDEGSRVVPANAGYRVGSAPVILRFTQTGAVAGADSLAKTVQVFAEEVKTLQIRGGVVDVLDN